MVKRFFVIKNGKEDSMKDRIFDTIISVLPTIGKIVGGLLNELNDSSYMGFLGKRLENDELDKAVFTMEDEKIYLCNTAVHSDDLVAFSTSTVDNVSDTVILKGMTRMDVTEAIKECSKSGGDNISLTSSKNVTDSNEITILTSGKGISFKEISNGGKVTLGNFIQIQWHELPKLIFSGLAVNYPLQEIVSIHIEGNNYEYDAIYPEQTKVTDNMIEINVDEYISAKQLYDIRVQAKFLQQDSGFLDSKAEVLTEEDIQKLILRKKNRGL